MPDAKVKVLDFGLPTMFDTESSGRNLSQSPTMMTATAGGVILGTAAYMSPRTIPFAMLLGTQTRREIAIRGLPGCNPFFGTEI
jgi:hypothetical protein